MILPKDSKINEDNKFTDILYNLIDFIISHNGTTSSFYQLFKTFKFNIK
jgi:hypothetical protein